MKSSHKIMIGLVAGVVLGMIMSTMQNTVVYNVVVDGVLQIVATLFMNALKLMIVPLVFVSIICGVSELSDISKLGKIGLKTVGIFFATTIIAIVIGLSIAYLFAPGANLGLDPATIESTVEVAESKTLVETVTSIIPTNPIAALSAGDMLQVIFMSIIVGISLVVLGDKTKDVKKLFLQVNEIMTFLITSVMHFAPIGIFALIARTFASLGIDVLDDLMMFVVCVVIAIMLHTFVVYGVLLKTMGKVNPFIFFKKFAKVMTIAFSTSSSSASLPENLKVSTEELGIDKEVSAFALPLGATIHMDGTAIMQGVAVVFIANAYGFDLSVVDLITVVVVAIIASVGTAGVPGVGMVMLSLVLESVGIPAGAIALVIGVDRIVDMFRTMSNVTGDAACALIVARSEGCLNDVVYESEIIQDI